MANNSPQSTCPRRWFALALLIAVNGVALGAGDNALLVTGGRMHPAIVHFPIALIVTALIFESLRIAIRHDRPSTAALGCLVIAVVSATLAAVSGWVHADVEGFAGDGAVELHRWMGIASGSLALVALGFGITARGGDWRVSRRLYVLFLLLSTGSVGVSGYLGGELVYGEGYLFEPIFGTAEDATETTNTAFRVPTGPVPEFINFERDLLPTFVARCVKCHGPRKQNGKLRLDSQAQLRASRYFDEIVVAGDPEESTIYQRIILPRRDRDHMPKRRKSLSQWEIEAIKRWIEAQ